MDNPDQRNTNEIKIAESLLAIEGRLARIEKTLDDLTVVLEMLARYIMQEKDDATQKPGRWEVDTWRPEKQ